MALGEHMPSPRTDRERLADQRNLPLQPWTKRELVELGELILSGLKAGSIAIEAVPDQAAITNKSYTTMEDIVGIVLSGRFPHEFQVAVVQAWAGWPVSPSASATIESHRHLFFAELLRLVPHVPDSERTTPDDRA